MLLRVCTGVVLVLALASCVLSGPEPQSCDVKQDVPQQDYTLSGVDANPDPDAATAAKEGNSPTTFDSWPNVPVGTPLLDVPVPGTKIHDMAMHQGSGTVCLLFENEYETLACYALTNHGDDKSWDTEPRYYQLDGSEINTSQPYWISFDFADGGNRICASQPTPGGIWCWKFPSLPSSFSVTKSRPARIIDPDYIRDGDALISPGDYYGTMMKMSTSSYAVSADKGSKGSAPVVFQQNPSCGNRNELRVADASFFDSKDKPLFYLNGVTNVNDFCLFFPLHPDDVDGQRTNSDYALFYNSVETRPAGYDPALIIGKYPSFDGFGTWKAPSVTIATYAGAGYGAMPSITYDVTTKVTNNPTRLERGTLANARCAQVLDAMLVTDGIELRLLDIEGSPRSSIGPFDGTLSWVRSSIAWNLHGARSSRIDLFAVVVDKAGGQRLQVWTASKRQGALLAIGAAAAVVAIGGAGYAYKRNKDAKVKRRQEKRAAKRARRSGANDSRGSRNSVSKAISGSRKSSGSRKTTVSRKSTGSRKGSRV